MEILIPELVGDIIIPYHIMIKWKWWCNNICTLFSYKCGDNWITLLSLRHTKNTAYGKKNLISLRVCIVTQILRNICSIYSVSSYCSIYSLYTLTTVYTVCTILQYAVNTLLLLYIQSVHSYSSVKSMYTNTAVYTL